jgi:hypothetical protein
VRDKVRGEGGWAERKKVRNEREEGRKMGLYIC